MARMPPPVQRDQLFLALETLSDAPAPAAACINESLIVQLVRGRVEVVARGRRVMRVTSVRVSESPQEELVTSTQCSFCVY